MKPSSEGVITHNIWHDRNELDEFINTIKKLSVEDDFKTWTWSKSRNWNCKYINLRFDMRDGGFILTNDAGQRISLDELKYQGEE